MKRTACKLLLSVFVTFAQLIAPSLTGRAGGESLHAQDAFYIYRNDGDFNGFFYDQVVRMGYSKFDLDSVEHDVYVVQDVETVDSLYRIPLAAIDSIGFQQPEIKMNPKVKFVSQIGMLPYIESASNECVIVYDLPSDLFPEPGDILIGLPTDEIAGERYSGGSFGFVMDYWQPDKWGDSKRRWLIGHAVEKLSDVFEQFVTVEDISVTPQGKVRRRIAGCDQNGIPRHASEGSGKITIFDISGTFSRKWNPASDMEISFSADVGITHKMRVEYNIGWDLFVKISRDLIIKTKPSLGMSLSKDFESSFADITGFPSIYFPTTCPIFQTDPLPELFVRTGGSLSASLNLPAVKLGFGDYIILDTKQIFPVRYGMHWVPEADEVDDSMLDLSGGISMSGFAQTGVKFKADLQTARWFQKILAGDIGFFMYCGPKVEGSASISADLVNNEGIGKYDVLQNLNLNVAWLSIDLEAKATASALWQDPVSKTFFSKNWSFFTDTLGFVPAFDKTTYEVNGQSVNVTIYPKRSTFTPCHLDIGIFDKDATLVKTIGGWAYKQQPLKDDPPFAATTSLEPGRYYARPLVTMKGDGPYYGPHIYNDDFLIWPDVISSVEFRTSGQGGSVSFSVPVTASRMGNTYVISGGGEYKDPNRGKVEATINVTAEILDGLLYKGLRVIGGSAKMTSVKENHVNDDVTYKYIRNVSCTWSDELRGDGPSKSGESGGWMSASGECHTISGNYEYKYFVNDEQTSGSSGSFSSDGSITLIFHY